MKFRKIISLLLLLSYNFLTIQAQPWEYTFDSDLEGWTSTALSNTAAWLWESDGKADRGAFWNDRNPIHSISMGGAAVFDSDGNITDDVGTVGSSYNIALKSPVFDLSTISSAYLSFHQYYRRADTSGMGIPADQLFTNTFVEINVNNTGWTSIYDNTLLPQGFETSASDRQVIDISSHTGNAVVKIRFRFSGSHYFWILDDIGIYEAYPYPVTLPTYVGDTLTSLGYPWHPDKPIDAWAYVPNQAVVQFAEGVADSTKAAIRETLGAERIDSCVCNKLELWEFADTMIVPNSMFPNGGTIGINEKVKGATTQSDIDGIDLNRYNYNELIQDTIPPDSPLVAIPSGITVSPNNIPTIAILDTGIDYYHNSLVNYIYRATETLNQTDSDLNCLDDDVIGWNFVNNNNNPFDDHGHGTHVAGIIVQQALQNDPNTNFRIRSYKTHDEQGVSTLFNVTCGTYQAIQDDVSVINGSWGFYGDSSIILSNAIDTARVNNVLIVTASGNDSIYLDTLQQYPACYDYNNIITVGAYDTPEEETGSNIAYAHPNFSNYDSQFVDILAPGVNILSTIPNNTMDIKTGTSMAAPAVAASAINLKYQGIYNYGQIKNCILNNATLEPSLTPKVNSGRILNWATCAIPTTRYSSLYALHSNNIILPGAKVHFSSGNLICLSPGFEVKLGAEFKATIDGCLDGN